MRTRSIRFLSSILRVETRTGYRRESARRRVHFFTPIPVGSSSPRPILILKLGTSNGMNWNSGPPERKDGIHGTTTRRWIFSRHNAMERIWSVSQTPRATMRKEPILRMGNGSFFVRSVTPSPCPSSRKRSVSATTSTPPTLGKSIS